MLFRNEDFPNLHAGNHRDTSPADPSYNCIAWGAGSADEWWEPKKGASWPGNAPRDYKVASVVRVYESAGFAICPDGSQEDGIEKIAIYTDGDEYMHAARQLKNGKWTSKMGADVDIEHDAPEDLAGPCYGCVTTFMKRQG